jgi:hypothetical protein
MPEKLTNYKNIDFSTYKYGTLKEISIALNWAIEGLKNLVIIPNHLRCLMKY